MKFLNFGSLNIDMVYHDDHFVSAGETLESVELEIFHGGKGLNQSISLSRAGADTYHAGCIGNDGESLKETLKNNHINTDFIKTINGPNGHAIIQIDKNGENAILLYGGSNQMIEKSHIDEVLSYFCSDDVLIVQNEINNLEYLIEQASKKGMPIVLNPSPINEVLLKMDLSKVSVMIMNEIEAAALSGKHTPKEMLNHLRQKYPNTILVLTLGKSGVVCDTPSKRVTHGIYEVPLVDTTAAGDTFTGYFIASYMSGTSIEESLRLASTASALAISVLGASPSIPTLEQVHTSKLCPIKTNLDL